MFVVLLEYIAPLETIDALLKRHVAYLEIHFRSGTFIAAGRRQPRTGGVILARADSREQLEDLLATDPFVSEGAARFEIVEFRTSLYAPGFADYADPQARPVR